MPLNMGYWLTYIAGYAGGTFVLWMITRATDA